MRFNNENKRIAYKKFVKNIFYLFYCIKLFLKLKQSWACLDE